MMADVANALNALTPSRPETGSVIPPESPDSVVLSPSIKEAMDRILPKTASQLLQPVSYEQHYSQNSPFSNQLPCPLNTKPDSTYRVKTGGLYTPALEKPSAPEHNYTSSANPCDTLKISSKDSSDKKRQVDKLRISKADLEIITSSVDLIDNDNSLETSSDPEDMTRCFSGVYREKRKHKKKRKRAKTSPERKGVVSRDYSSVSEEDDCEKCVVSAGHNESNSRTQPFGSRNNEIQESLPALVSSFDSKLSNGIHVELRNCMNDCQSSIAIGRALPKNGFNNDCAIGNEDVSNISTSSSKENVISQRKHSGQKLPRTKRLQYNIVRHKGKIKNTFLPAFVVLKKCDSLHSQRVSNSSFDLGSNVLPLSMRVKHLAALCNSGYLDCKKRKQKGVILVDQPVYKNIFEENVLLGLSDEESEGSLSRRSLRKRVKNISYVEPTEDDIMEDFSRKRRRSKVKDSGSGCDTDTSQENKRRKRNDKSEVNNKMPEKVVDKTSEKPSCPVDQVTNDKEMTSQDKATANKTIQEIIVFPPTPIVKGPEFALAMAKHNAQNVRDSNEKKSRSRGKVKAAVPPESSQPAPVVVNSLQPSNPIRKSVFSTPPRYDLFPPPPPVSVPMFSLNPPGFPPVMTTMSTPTNLPQLLGSPPFPTSSQKQPQYCIMKVDGKDVLLQLVPSGNLGASVLLPGGKKIVVRPSMTPLSSPPLISPPIRPLSLSQPVTAPPVTLPAVQSNASLTAAFPNLFGVPIVSGNVNSTASSMPYSGLPVISFSNVGGFHTPVTARSSITPGACLAPPLAPLATTVPLVSLIPTPTVTGVTSSAVRMTNSTSTVSTSSVTVMSAPASKPTRPIADQLRATVRPTLRAVVPNQTSSLRAIRIFVPGCTSTGTPGRFTTLGSVANSSPLTRLSASSDLLPQRKQSSDQELTPEQKAAKRRKLEKKYPLPPGVVIKTEPLESLPSTPAVQTSVRSLLNSNIQLVSSVARPGTTVRIIAPSLASALTSNSIRSNHNIIFRASSDGNSTVLVPTTIGQLSSVVSTLPSPSTVIVSQAGTTTTVTSASPSPYTTTTVSTSAAPQNISKQSVPSVFVSPSAKAAHTQSPSPAIWSPASSLSEKSTLGLSAKPSSSQPSNRASPFDSPQQASSEKQLTEGSLEEFKISLMKIRELVHKQESLGLKGERLEKLKELVQKKEVEFEKMKKQFEVVSADTSHDDTVNNIADTDATSDKLSSDIAVEAMDTDTVRETVDVSTGTPLLGTASDPYILD